MTETPGQPPGPGPADDAERSALPTWNRSRSKRSSEPAVATAEVVDAIPAEDVFQRGVRQAGTAAARRVPLLLGGLVVVAALGAGFAAWRQHAATERATATGAIAQASALVSRAMADDPLLADRKNPPPFPIFKDEADRQAQIEKQLEALRQAGGPAQKLFGDLLVAAQAMRSRDWAKAIAAYDHFVTQAPADHALRALALEGRCIAKENQGDLSGALSDAVILGAADSAEPGRTMGQWHEARILALQGDNAAALPKLKALTQRANAASLPFDRAAKHLLERIEAGDKVAFAPLVILPKDAAPPAGADAAAAALKPSPAVEGTDSGATTQPVAAVDTSGTAASDGTGTK